MAKYLISPGWREFWDAIGGDTIAKVMDDIAEASTHPPHSLRPPVPKETLEIIKEVADAYNEHRDLSHEWEGK